MVCDNMYEEQLIHRKKIPQRNKYLLFLLQLYNVVYDKVHVIFDLLMS